MMWRPKLRRRPRFVVLLPALLLLLLAPLRPADAGFGKRRAGDPSKPNVLDVLDLTVYFDYDPTPTEFENWSTVLEEFSKRLYDATEGQLRLGTVELTTCPSLRTTADIWVHSRWNNACANARGLARPSRWIHLYQIHQCTGDDPKQTFRYLYDEGDVCNGGLRAQALGTCGDAVGQFGLLHEAGHYLFGLGDEYEGLRRFEGFGFGVTPPDNERHHFYCAHGKAGSGLSSTTSVMDGGTGKTGKNRRTEFCVSHATDGQFEHQHMREAAGFEYTTSQEEENNGSCWDTLAGVDRDGIQLEFKQPQSAWSFYRRTRLFLEPIDGDPKEQSLGDEKPDCKKVTGKPGFLFLIDTSRSMEALVGENLPSRLAVARKAARNAIRTIKDDELVGMIAFDSVLTPFDALTPVAPATADRRVLLDAAIGRLLPKGNTATGLALQEACEIFGGLGPETVSAKSIILLSDGLNTVGRGPLAVLDDEESCKDVRIHTIALGASADRETLEAIAKRTGGTFEEAIDPALLPRVLLGVVGTARGETELFAATDSVKAQEANREDVLVSPLAREVTFLLSHEAGAPLRLEIQSPEGHPVYVEAGIACVHDTRKGVEVCDIVFQQQDPAAGSTLQFFRIEDPEPGPWKVSVVHTGLAGSPEEAYDLLVTALAPAMDVGASVPRVGPIQWPNPIPIEVNVVADVPVAGATVKARVFAPGGAVSEELTLRDTGAPEHGDLVANDGVYSVLFLDYTTKMAGGGSGTWEIAATIESDCSTATAADVCSEDGPEPATEQRIPSFQARAGVSVVVTGVPEVETLGNGTVQFAAATASTAVGPIPNDEADVTPVTPFSLTVSGESVKLMSLSITSIGSGDESTVDEVGLFLDMNADGLPDNRHRPLAWTRFDADDGTATFSRSDGMLILLEVGKTHFVIGFGSRHGDFAGEELFLKAPPERPGVLPPTPPWELHLISLLAFIAGACLVARRRSRRPMAVGVCVGLGFLVLITGSVGCGCANDIGPFPMPTGGPNWPVQPKVGQYTFTVDPQDFTVLGGTTPAPLPVTGNAFQQVVTITEGTP